jgi:CopG family transcriptional regulator, nickel-responsive regulator
MVVIAPLKFLDIFGLCVTFKQKSDTVTLMPELVRFGVSLDKELLERFDELLQAKHYNNRSEAIRDLIRHDLVTREWQEGKDVAGAITLVYDHHQRELLSKMTDVQHDFQKVIISTQHIHLDHDNCLEIVAVRGTPRAIDAIVKRLKAVKGLKHVALAAGTTGQRLA